MLLVSVLVGACARRHDAAPVAKDSNAAARKPRPELVLIGTSLTAGYGLDPADSWAAHLQQKIDSAGLDYTVTNAGVSGETSADALHRINWLLGSTHPAVIVLETGAND